MTPAVIVLVIVVALVCGLAFMHRWNGGGPRIL